MTRSNLSILLVADVSPLQPSGGSARVLREQTRRLSGRGHSVTVLCRHPEGELPLRQELNGAPVVHYRVSRTNPISYATSSLLGARRAFAIGLRDQPWDVAVFHQPFSAVGVQSTMGNKPPQLYCFHSPAGVEYRLRAADPETGRTPIGTGVVGSLMNRLERRAIRRSNCTVVLSDFSRRLLRDTHGEVSALIVTIPGGVDLEHFHPPADRRALRERLGIPKNSIFLLTVRDLERRMGIDTLLQALGELPPDRNFYCVIGGGGPMRSFLEGQAARLGLGNRVRFVGHIPEQELPAYYQASDLFVLPTRSHEGFGLVTVEALACGAPVVATPVGATPEILAPLDRRLVSADSGATSLARSLLQAVSLAENEDFRTRCRRYAEAKYSWAVHAEALENQLLALYEQRLSSSSSSVGSKANSEEARL